MEQAKQKLELSTHELVSAALRKAEWILTQVTIYEESRWQPVVDLLREVKEKLEQKK